MTGPMRKLLWIACGYCGALLLCRYGLPAGWQLGAALMCALFALPGGLLLRNGLRRRVMTLLLAAAVGFGWSWGYGRLVLAPAERFVGTERSVRVMVLRDPNVYDDYTSVLVRSADDTVPGGKILVYDYSGGMTELRPGDVAELPLKLLSAGQYYRQPSDHYYAQGVVLRGYIKGEWQVTGHAGPEVRWLPQTLARAVSRQAETVFPTEAVPLMKALLIGDRSDYYDNDALSTDMKAAGFSHVIAVSGMHISFLVAALGLAVRRKKAAAALGIPVIVLFMLMTGLTPSVYRAGLMQILLLIAPLVGREADEPTNLAAAALLLTLRNPYAVADLSFQLSFSAMAGLILVSPRAFDRMTRRADGSWRLPHGAPGWLLRRVCAGVSASLGAAIFTMPICALQFGSVAIYSLLSNLLGLWAVSGAFLLGYLSCLLGWLAPVLGRGLGWAVGWLPRYILWLVRLIAGLPQSQVLTRGNLGGWCVVAGNCALAAVLAFGRRKQLRIGVGICAAMLAMCFVLRLPQLRQESPLLLAAVDVGQGQSLAALTAEETVVIDCGNSISPVNAGDAMADFLLRYGRKQVDVLVMTHFHEDHANGVERLMNRVTVGKLVYAEACEDSPERQRILQLCAQRGTELCSVSEDELLELGVLRLQLYAPGEAGGANERCLMLRGSYDDFDFLVTGDAGSTAERALCRSRELGDLELLVVGHHGSKSSACAELLDTGTPETAWISVGANNTYGHPAAEVLERLAQRSIAVYRTDEDGTITISVGENHG